MTMSPTQDGPMTSMGGVGVCDCDKLLTDEMLLT